MTKKNGAAVAVKTLGNGSSGDSEEARGEMTYLDATEYLLGQHGPMHYQDLIATMIEKGLVRTTALDPASSLNSRIAVDIKLKGEASRFIRVRPGVFGLRALHHSTLPAQAVQAARNPSEGSPSSELQAVEARVSVPLFPAYHEVRHLLRSWVGFPRQRVTGFEAKLKTLRGTPQNNVDWSNPDEWISERLKGEDRQFAQSIWETSKGEVNPRHTYGHWLLVTRYGFLQDGADGNLALTEEGRRFLEEPGGDVEAALDETEGLFGLLSLVADNGSTAYSGLLPDWENYLKKWQSPFAKESTIRDSLSRRLKNLLLRELIERRGGLYSATPEGLLYLQRSGDEDSSGDNTDHDIQVLVRRRETAVREGLLDLLFEVDPYAFESIVKRLLEAMGYQDVEVTSQGGDGGVDVIGSIELGITSVREVVQVKRHRNTIQRKELDALRGSLYRFNAVRGTIVTTSRFAKGAEEAAFANGAPPITLIDGEKLVSLLIEHGIGVEKRSFELLQLEPGAFAGSGEEA